MPISKSLRQFIVSLQQKKTRMEEQRFVVEGTKSVQELMQSDFEITHVVATEESYADPVFQSGKITPILVKEDELKSIGSLQSNNGMLAVAVMKPRINPVVRPDEFIVALDDIRDPGNFGTIIRTADWYGIRTIVASESSADFYNAKTISATMGSFCRVAMHYTSLPEWLRQTTLKKFGAFLDGDDVHSVAFANGGVIVIGNESKGISSEVEAMIDQRITIPRYGRAESLNAGISTAIILDNAVRSNS